ncbi:MAG: porin [Proteobacteria bacterium]|nr:porin [Pseudomonadota bacterium]
MKASLLASTLFAAGALTLTAGVAFADPLPAPSFAGPLAPNPNPVSVDAGPLGKVSVGGALSGLGLAQDHPVPGDQDSTADLSNGQIWIEKTDGPVQFYVQAGAYSLPALGSAYIKSTDATTGFYGAVPVAFLKFAPNSEFSVQVGKLPTLIGAESTFTFQNMNLARGLLWNQEPAVSRGVQANWAKGPVSLSVSVNDGFYSNKYNWVSGSLAYTLNPADTVTLIGSGNTGTTNKSTLATPLVQNNSQIWNLIWTHSKGAWTVTPYLQYTHAPASTPLGIAHEASTTGGALLVKYAFNPTFSLAGRGEYIGSTGSLASGAPSLLYGPGSRAWSLTLTPTWQFKTFFVRGEASYVKADHVTPGFAFGASGTATSQSRAMIETGLLF